MNVSLQNIDKVSALLTVKLEKADYQERVDKALKHLRTYQKRLVMRELKTATNDVERKVLVNRLKEIDKTRSAMPCFAPYGRKLQEA